MPTVPWAALASLGLGLGTYSIGLQVTDSFGVRDTDTTAVSIYRNGPVAVLTANPNPAAPGQEITFDASGSTHGHPDRSIVQYEWDFDYDGTFVGDASGVQVTHVYGQVGVYTTALRVTDDNVPAKTDLATVVVTINQGNHPPVANAGPDQSVSVGVHGFAERQRVERRGRRRPDVQLVADRPAGGQRGHAFRLRRR